MTEELAAYGKITILGHDNIDVDAFISGVLLSNLLTFLEIDNEFIVLQEVKEDDTYHIVKELFGIDMKDYYSTDEDSTRKLFLEDHYETIHSGKVVACIDHHPTSENVKYNFHRSRIASSTSCMIYELMQEVGYQISAEEAKMIVASMMVDTVSFRSRKTVREEAEMAKEMAKQYNLSYDELEKYCLCLTLINQDMSIEDIINNGYKYYNYNGYRVKSSYIQIYGMVTLDYILEWLGEIHKQVKKESLAMWVFIIFECKDNITYEYRVLNHGDTKLTITAGILSRGTNIMPKVEDFFNNQ